MVTARPPTLETNVVAAEERAHVETEASVRRRDGVKTEQRAVVRERLRRELECGEEGKHARQDALVALD